MLKDLIAKNRLRALGLLERLAWLAPLLGRLSVGLLFLSTGWGKAHSLDMVTKFFIELKIPMPALNAVVVAYSELVCGALLVVGLFTRLATIPMIVNMLVALAVVVLPGISTLDEFVELDEVLYVAVLFWLLVAGPGKASLDHLVARRSGWMPASA